MYIDYNMWLWRSIGLTVLMTIGIALVITVCFKIREISAEVRLFKGIAQDVVEKNEMVKEQIIRIESMNAQFKGTTETVVSDLQARISRLERSSGDVLLKALERLSKAIEDVNEQRAIEGAGEASETVTEPMEAICDGANNIKLPAQDKYDEIQRRYLDAVGKCIVKLDDQGYIKDLMPGGDYDGDDDFYTTDFFDELDYDVTYRWIFPDKEKDSSAKPVYGQYYLTVGETKAHLKQDGTPMIWTEDAMWNGYLFVGKSGARFDKVYAYIQMPTSADVMEQVVSLALKKAG